MKSVQVTKSEWYRNQLFPKKTVETRSNQFFFQLFFRVLLSCLPIETVCTYKRHNSRLTCHNVTSFSARLRHVLSKVRAIGDAVAILDVRGFQISSAASNIFKFNLIEKCSEDLGRKAFELIEFLF